MSFFSKFLGQGLTPGTPAPEFNLPDQNNQFHSLASYPQKWVLLYFYPRDFTPGCTKEACSFRDEYSFYRERGIVLFGVSTDSVEKHAEFSKHHQLPFPVLADEGGKISEAYEVLLPFGISNRITYLISPERKIVKTFKWVAHGDYAKIIQRSVEEEISKRP